MTETIDTQELTATASRSVQSYVEHAYLDYSMYVILDRALPRLEDGLKPVQRRILYAMSELGLRSGSGFKKSARTVGDVIGKYHPHGDRAVYEAMVLMAQSFSSRYPLIEGQGNWGSIDDPRSFAAMRYTEARLTPYANTLLEEIRQGTVDWTANFDGSMGEPSVLPARLPHVLLNGTSGIAVGMATDIPSHNMRELVAACLILLKRPGATLDTLLQKLPGPDFAGGATIVSQPEEIRAAYATGRGNLKVRAKWHKEESQIVIDELPPQLSCNRVLEQIAKEITDKRLPGAEDVRDEGDEESPVRLVVALTSRRQKHEEVMEHLYAATDLEKTVRVNLNLLDGQGRPQVLGLQALLLAWLERRAQVLRLRLQHRLDQVEKRLHNVQGLIVAYASLDEVIAIIRKADKPKESLCVRFGLTPEQASAILDLRLRQLARLEEQALRKELSVLEEEQKELNAVLNWENGVKELMAQELRADVKAFGDERRTAIEPVDRRRISAKVTTERTTDRAPMSLYLSRQGWVCSQRGNKDDLPAVEFRGDDETTHCVRGLGSDWVIFVDEGGRIYSAPMSQFRSAQGKGVPLTHWFTLPSGAHIVDMTRSVAQETELVFVTKLGQGMRVPVAFKSGSRRTPKQTLVLREADALVSMRALDSTPSELVCLVDSGRLMLLDTQQIPSRGGGVGTRLLQVGRSGGLLPDELVIAAELLPAGATLQVHTQKRHKRLEGKALEPYRRPLRRRPVQLPQGFRSVTSLQVEVPEEQ